MLNLNLSFRSLNHEFFKDLLNYLREELLMLNRLKFFNMITKRVELVKKHILNDLQFVIKLSLTLNY